MTNADTIRKMSDEQLADILEANLYDCACCAMRYDVCIETDETPDINCNEQILKWLKQEIN